MDELFAFMASPAGRAIRILAGIVLIVVGIAVVQGVWGWIMAVVGLVPLLAGLFDVCLLARLFGRPLKGASLRAHE